YPFPPQSGHSTYTSGRKFIPMVLTPAPSHPSHLRPLILNEKRPGPKPLTSASGVIANRCRISVKTPVYVAGFDLGVRPMGAWSTSITLSMFSSPSIDSYDSGVLPAPCSFLASAGWRVWLISDDLPLPETPVMQMNVPSGTFIVTPFRL